MDFQCCSTDVILVRWQLFSFSQQADGRLHLISSEVKNELILRLAICSPKTNEKYLEEAWKIIMELNDNNNSNSNGNSNSRPSKEKRTTETEDTIKREYY